MSAKRVGISQFTAVLSTAELERELAAAEAHDADDDYIETLRAILCERRALRERETETMRAVEATKEGSEPT